MHSKILIEKLNSWLIIGLFFFIPISTAMGSIISLFIFILWILDANFRNQFMQFKSNSVAIASIVFYFVFIVSFGESYLSIHVTSLFFCLISAVIFAENKIKPT